MITWKSCLLSAFFLLAPTFPAMAAELAPDSTVQPVSQNGRQKVKAQTGSNKRLTKTKRETINAKAEVAKAPAAAEDEVRQVLRNFSNAVSSNDANLVASLWSDDACFIDQSGESTTGKDNLRERFARMFAQKEAETVTLHPDRIVFPASNVSIVEGEVSKKAGLSELPTSRFSLVLVKNDANWFINSGTETVIQDIKAADRLRELAWLIGNWRVDKTGPMVKLEVSWSEGHNFIVSKCIIENKGSQPQIDKQIIGYDPRSNSLVSWHFDYNGGFGYGKWRTGKDTFTLDYAGVSPSGHSTRASNTFTVKGPDEFSWQSTGQTANEEGLPDSEVMQVHRDK